MYRLIQESCWGIDVENKEEEETRRIDILTFLIMWYEAENVVEIDSNQWERIFVKQKIIRWDDVGWIRGRCLAGQIPQCTSEKECFWKETSDSDSQLKNEYEIRKFLQWQISSPYLIPLWFVILDDEKKKIQGLVFPYQKNAISVDQLSGTDPFTWMDLMSIWKDLASALEWLHKRNVIHHDIHPSNVLILLPDLSSESKVKAQAKAQAKAKDSTTRTAHGLLLDLGVSEIVTSETQFQGDPCKKRFGHDGAPEQEDESLFPITFTLDIWHLAHVILLIASHISPWKPKIGYSFPLWFRLLISQSLTPNPLDRLTASQLIQQLDVIQTQPHLFSL